MFKKIFKAKWQNNDPVIRQQALLQLDPLKDAEIILSIAKNDPSFDIRSFALQKISHSEHVEELLISANNPTDWLVFAVKLNELLPQIEQLARAFKEKCVNWNELEIITAIGGCKDTTLANKLLIDIEHPQALFEVALNAKAFDIRLEAVNKIDDIELLQRLSKESTNKQVLKLVKQKLSSAKHRQQQLEECQNKAAELVSAMSKLSQQSWFDAQYEIKVNALISKWQQLENESNLIDEAAQKISVLKAEFNTQCEQCQLTIQNNYQKMQQLALQEDAKNKQVELNLQMSQLVSEINEQENIIEINGSSDTNLSKVFELSIKKYQSIKSAAEFLIKSWNETADLNQPTINLNSQYLKLKAILESYFESWEKLIELENQISVMLKTTPQETFESLNAWIEDWKKLFKRVNWPSKIELPHVIVNWNLVANEIEEKYQTIFSQQKKKAAYINQKIKQLEKEINRKNLIAANKLNHYINLQLNELNDNFRTSILHKVDKLQPNLDELKDWHAFATIPKKEALCQSMEALQKESIHPLEMANRVRQLQKQWRELKASDTVADEAHWQRFKQASDIAYAPCLQFYAEQDKLKAENLNHRIEICNKLESLIKEKGWGTPVEDSNGVNDSDAVKTTQTNYEQRLNKADWISIEKMMSSITKQWNQYQLIPENEREVIQSHFNDLVSLIKNKINNEKQQNLALRVDLVEKAVQLLTLENIEDAIKSALQLQKEWKLIGITFFKGDREQWKKFRQAIDTLFAKRDEIKQSNQQVLKNNQDKIIERTSNINQLTNVDDLELRATFGLFESFKNDLPQESELPKKIASKLLADFENACQGYLNHLHGLESRLEKRRLIDFIEGAQLLQNAEENILDTKQYLPADELESLQMSLDSLFLDVSDSSILSSRFAELSKINPIMVNQQGTDLLMEMALELEIMLSISSPDEFAQQRMTIQLNKLQAGLGNTLTEKETIHLLISGLKKWLSIGFVDASIRSNLDTRKSAIFKSLNLI